MFSEGGQVVQATLLWENRFSRKEMRERERERERDTEEDKINCSL
jgi:hypothetical protein